MRPYKTLINYVKREIMHTNMTPFIFCPNPKNTFYLLGKYNQVGNDRKNVAGLIIYLFEKAVSGTS